MNPYEMLLNAFGQGGGAPEDTQPDPARDPATQMRVQARARQAVSDEKMDALNQLKALSASEAPGTTVQIGGGKRPLSADEFANLANMSGITNLSLDPKNPIDSQTLGKVLGQALSQKNDEYAKKYQDISAAILANAHPQMDLRPLAGIAHAFGAADMSKFLPTPQDPNEVVNQVIGLQKTAQGSSEQTLEDKLKALHLAATSGSTDPSVMLRRAEPPRDQTPANMDKIMNKFRFEDELKDAMRYKLGAKQTLLGIQNNPNWISDENITNGIKRSIDSNTLTPEDINQYAGSPAAVDRLMRMYSRLKMGQTLNSSDRDAAKDWAQVIGAKSQNFIDAKKQKYIDFAKSEGIPEDIARKGLDARFTDFNLGGMIEPQNMPGAQAPAAAQPASPVIFGNGGANKDHEIDAFFGKKHGTR